MKNKINIIKTAFCLIMIYAFCIACSRDEDPIEKKSNARVELSLATLASGTDVKAVQNVRIYLFETGSDQLVDYYYNENPATIPLSLKMKALLEKEKMDIIVLLNFAKETAEGTTANVFNNKTTRNTLENAVWNWKEMTSVSSSTNIYIPRVYVGKEITSTEEGHPLVLSVPSILAKVNIRIAKLKDNTDKVQVNELKIQRFPSMMYILPRSPNIYPTNASLNNIVVAESYTDDKNGSGNVDAQLPNSPALSDFPIFKTVYVPENLNVRGQDAFEIVVDYTLSSGGQSINRINTVKLIESSQTLKLLAIRNKQIDIKYTVNPIETDADINFSLTLSSFVPERNITLPPYE